MGLLLSLRQPHTAPYSPIQPYKGLDRPRQPSLQSTLVLLGKDARLEEPWSCVGKGRRFKIYWVISNLLISIPMSRIALLFFLLLASLTSLAQPLVQGIEHTWIARDFKFHTGEVFKELQLGYQTLGDPSAPAVLVLHGTAGSAKSLMTPQFAGQLFGPGQALDASKYFIVIPDNIGVGHSSKPSDGLRRNFPRYNYQDMVMAQYRLITEGLGLRHLRLVLGNSMGGMQTWLWGTQYPDFMDLLVPMASTPSAMSGRNWMMRRLLIESIVNDPTWKDGNYTEQPKNFQIASAFFSIATSGGTKALQRMGSTKEQADALVYKRIKEYQGADANDNLYQWESSADFNPEPDLKKIKARVLMINAEDDERNPPELGHLQRAIDVLSNARLLLIPSSDQTAGHSTTGQAKWWHQELAKELQSLPLHTP